MPARYKTRNPRANLPNSIREKLRDFRRHPRNIFTDASGCVITGCYNSEYPEQITENVEKESYARRTAILKF